MIEMLDTQSKIQETIAQSTKANESNADNINKNSEFMTIFNSKTQKTNKQEPSTIGDMKNQKTNITDDSNDLIKTIRAVLGEGSEITSLNLTLEKDNTNDCEAQTEEAEVEILSAENIENIEILTGLTDLIDTENLENTEITENTENMENTEISENIGTLEDVDKIETPETAENAEISQNIENIDLYAALISTQKDTSSIEKNPTSDEKCSLYEELLNSVNPVNDENSTLNIQNEQLSALDETLFSASQDVVAENISTKSETQDFNTSLNEEMLEELEIESISTEVDTDSSDNETFLQDQSLEEHGIKTALNIEAEAFETKFQNIEKSSQAQTPVTKPTTMSSEKIIEQITKQMDGLFNTSKLNIVLKPEALGRVNIQLMNTKDGLMAQFMVETPEARDMLMKGLEGLKDSLGAHGVNVDNVSVKLNNAQKSEYKQDWTEQEGQKGGNREQERQNKEEKEKGLFEKMMAATDENENGNV